MLGYCSVGQLTITAGDPPPNSAGAYKLTLERSM